jgi:hypothetical protein
VQWHDALIKTKSAPAGNTGARDLRARPTPWKDSHMSTTTPNTPSYQAPSTHRRRFQHQETLPADSPERIARRVRHIRILRTVGIVARTKCNCAQAPEEILDAAVRMTGSACGKGGHYPHIPELAKFLTSLPPPVRRHQDDRTCNECSMMR